jgi:hypothetical protein
MGSFFSQCGGCGVMTARVSELCLACDLERERAMSQHPSNPRRIRQVPKAARPLRRAHPAA